jgi:hypothetical protein
MFLSWYRNLRNTPTRRACPTRPARRTRLHVELLEDRLVPATISLSNGVLSISKPDTTGGTALQVTATGFDEFEVTDASGTYSTPSPVTKSISITDTNPGDTIDIDMAGHYFGGSLSINTETGSDTVSLVDSSAGGEIAGAVSVTGTGNDTVSLNNSSVETLAFGSAVTVTDHGSLTIGNGSAATQILGALTVTGMNNVTLSPGAADHYGSNITLSPGTLSSFSVSTGGTAPPSTTNGPTVVGNVLITGAPTSTVALSDLTILGNLTVNYAHVTDVSGGSSLDLTGAAGPCSVYGTFSYTGSPASVSLNLAGCLVDGNASILLDSGINSSDTVGLSGTLFEHNLSLTLGSGAVSVDLSATSGLAPGIGGNLTITGGNGSDNLALNGPIAAQIEGTASITLGSGSDTVAFQDVIQNSLSISLGSGNDSVTVSDAGVAETEAVGGSLSITLGSGDDSVGLSGASFDQNVTLKLGNGNDSVDLSNDVGPTSIGGNLSITGGTGAITFAGIDAQVTGNVSITLGTGFSNAVTFNADSLIGGTLTWHSGGADDSLTLLGPQVYVVNAQFGSDSTVTLDNSSAVLTGTLKGVGTKSQLIVTPGTQEILTLVDFSVTP